ncbi:selenoprotein O [Elstera litoralis]|uniref:Protein nucleotidyltransferase YdiU n=1 Tax=Elstera litoralis TaxID=552518 RepID=A0A0F3IZS1_9PROT|nr:YdiU family protein [Elstera litoralis]KJV11094.1 selenoprotein O [Elstera litoralis]
MPPSAAYRPSRSHAALGEAFYDPVPAAVFPKHILRWRNQRAAETVGLGGLTDAEWTQHFGQFAPLPGSFEASLALRYHGHQFRHYNPDLGDGRGFLFAQLYDAEGRLLDLGTKGSGRTPYSRAGDGRLTLKGGVREILATELLEARGVNTSKSFSLIETGEALHRGDEPSPTRSSVLVRLSHSHIRIGTFQRLAYLGQTEAIGRLIEYALATYWPQVAPGPVPALTLLAEVMAGVAKMGAQWMAAGFVHGVLNTDNINITGESFDYGPWRFLKTYDPRFTAAYFDESGLYAYGRQPSTLLWNLERLAECLMDFAPEADLVAQLERFQDLFRPALRAAWFKRLGLLPGDLDADLAFLSSLYQFLLDSGAGFEQTIFDWVGGDASRAAASPQRALYERPDFAPIRLGLETCADPAAVLPLGDGPVDLPIEDVEALWAPIAAFDDWSAFEAKIAAIRALA